MHRVVVRCFSKSETYTNHDSLNISHLEINHAYRSGISFSHHIVLFPIQGANHENVCNGKIQAKRARKQLKKKHPNNWKNNKSKNHILKLFYLES